MNITQITVSYGETQSLPEYSNVKPSITLTAVLNDGELAEEVETALWKMAKESVREQIDLALEANDRAAKWSDEPRYQVMKTYRDQWADRGKPAPPKIVVILPNELELARDAYGVSLVHAAYPESRKLRYAHARRIAESAVREYDGSTLLDCASGDLAPLTAALPPKLTEVPAASSDLSDEDRYGYAMADAEEDDRDLDEDDD